LILYFIFAVGMPCLTCSFPISATADHSNEFSHDLNRREIITLTPLAIACLVLGLFPNIILKTLDEPVMNLTKNANRIAFHNGLETQPAAAPYVKLDVRRVIAAGDAFDKNVKKDKTFILLPDLAIPQTDLIMGPELIRDPNRPRSRNDAADSTGQGGEQ